MKHKFNTSKVSIILSIFFCAPIHLWSMSSSQATNPIREALKRNTTAELKKIIDSYENHSDLVRNLNWSDNDGSNILYALIFGAREEYKAFKIIASAYKSDYQNLIYGLEQANQYGGACLAMATIKSSKEEALDLVLDAYNGKFTQKPQLEKLGIPIEKKYQETLLKALRRPLIDGSNIIHLAIQRNRPERLIKIIMAYGNNWEALLEDFNAAGKTGNALTAAVSFAAQVNTEDAHYRRNIHALEIIFNALMNMDGICKDDKDWAWFINSVNQLLFRRFSIAPIIQDQAESSQKMLFEKAGWSIKPYSDQENKLLLDRWKKQLKNVYCNALEVARVLECEQAVNFLKSMYINFGHTIPDQLTGDYPLPCIL